MMHNLEKRLQKITWSQPPSFLFMNYIPSVWTHDNAIQCLIFSTYLRIRLYIYSPVSPQHCDLRFSSWGPWVGSIHLSVCSSGAFFCALAVRQQNLVRPVSQIRSLQLSWKQYTSRHRSYVILLFPLIQTSRSPWKMPQPTLTLSLLTFLGRPSAGTIDVCRLHSLDTNLISSNQVTTRDVSYPPNFFFLTIRSLQIGGKRRRQAVSFVDYQGRATSNCFEATTYTLYAGQLFAQYANGTIAQFSAFSGEVYTILEPKTTVGDITTTFSQDSKGSLLWTNDAFYNGAARFCIVPSGDLVAVFALDAQPENCIFVDLTVSLCKSH